jgi:NitT/TauT family transport system permease protein
LPSDVATRLASLDDRLAVQWRRKRRLDLAAAVGLPLIIGIAFVAYWQGATTGSGQNVLIPSFTSFVAAAFDQLGHGDFWSAVWTSESALLLALGVAIVLGIPFGLYLGRHRTLDGLVSGYLDSAVVTPTAVFMPLIIVAFGPTFWARAVVIFIFAFPYIVLPIRVSSSTVGTDLVDMASSYGASRWQVWRDILVPASVPGIFTGLRQGVAHAFTGMFLIELTFLAVGIGSLLTGYEESFDPASVFGISLLVVLEALAVMVLLQSAQNRLSSSWREARQR